MRMIYDPDLRPWVIQDKEEKAVNANRLSWKTLAGILISNVGHIAIGLSRIAKEMETQNGR